MQAEAAATLTGLVFVAVSLNLTRILGYAGLPGRAAESILQLLEVFFVSSVALIPGQPANAVAWEILGLGLLFWVAQAYGLVRYLRARKGQPLSWFLSRTVLIQAAFLPYVAAGIAMSLGICGGIYWLIPGFFFSFAAAILGAWVLLIEILR